MGRWGVWRQGGWEAERLGGREDGMSGVRNTASWRTKLASSARRRRNRFMANRTCVGCQRRIPLCTKS